MGSARDGVDLFHPGGRRSGRDSACNRRTALSQSPGDAGIATLKRLTVVVARCRVDDRRRVCAVFRVGSDRFATRRGRVHPADRGGRVPDGSTLGRSALAVGVSATVAGGAPAIEVSREVEFMRAPTLQLTICYRAARPIAASCDSLGSVDRFSTICHTSGIIARASPEAVHGQREYFFREGEVVESMQQKAGRARTCQCGRNIGWL